jgi:hypothetical protein
MIPHRETFQFAGGFFPSAGDFPGPAGIVRDGSGAWFRGPDNWRSDKGYTSSGSPTIAAAATPIMVSNGVPSGVTGGGTVTRHALVPWAAGSGTAVEGATTLGSVSGQLMIYVGGTLVAAGLSAPASVTAPVIADSGVTGTKLSGSYSIALVAYRSTTGAVSNRSLPSNVVSVKNKLIRVTFPAVPTGATHWIIYGSRRGFGSVGPWFRITSLALTALPVGTYSVGTTFDVEWFDGELGELAPINYDPPPSSGVSHCVGMGGSMCALGPNGRISPSIVAKPEAYPVDFVTFIGSREAITSVTGRSTDGIAYVATANSLNVLITSGSDLTPVIPRGIWENTGFASGSAFTLVGRDIYGMAGSGPVRTHGDADPDQSFAAPVLQYMLDNGWTSANTIVVHAPDNHCVYFAKGTICLAYMLAGEEAGYWSTPITIPSATAGVTVGGVGYIASGATLYSLDKSGGTAAGSWFLQGPYQGAGEYLDNDKTLIYFKAASANNVTADLFDYATGASLGTPFPLSITAPHGTGWTPLNFVNVRGYALKVSGTGTNQRFRHATLDLLIEEMHT